MEFRFVLLGASDYGGMLDWPQAANQLSQLEAEGWTVVSVAPLPGMRGGHSLIATIKRPKVSE